MKNYKTTDIWIASGLHALGFSCKAEKLSNFVNGRIKYLFVFEPETEEEMEQLEILLDKYNREEMFVDVKTLQTSYKILKNLTFQ